MLQSIMSHKSADPVDTRTGILTGRCVVSVTPNALRSDSRTLKQAASIARAGARSIVVEGRFSNQSFSEIGIEIRSLKQARAVGGIGKPVDGQAAQSGLIKKFVKWLLPSKALNAAIFILTVLSLIRRQWIPLYRQLESADFYILHSFHFWPAVFLKTKISKSFYVYDAHDFYREMDQEKDVSTFTRDFLIPFYRWLDEKAVRYSRGMMTVSDGVAALYSRALGMRPVVFPNVHDRRLDRNCERSLRAITGVPDDRFLIVAVGNAKPGSSMLALTKAIELTDNSVEIAFVGDGFEIEQAQLRSTSVGKRIHFVNAIPADQIVPFIASADCGIIVYHAYTENYDLALPNRFFQSIAAEIPLIYPQLKEMQRLADEFSLGISCNPRDPDDIVRAISVILRDSALRATLKAQAERAALSLSWEREEGRFVAFLEGLASERPVQKSN